MIIRDDYDNKQRTENIYLLYDLKLISNPFYFSFERSLYLVVNPGSTSISGTYTSLYLITTLLKLKRGSHINGNTPWSLPSVVLIKFVLVNCQSTHSSCSLFSQIPKKYLQ